MAVRSLRTKLMLLFFIFFFVPFGLLTLFTVSMSREMMKKSTMDHLQNLVEVKETAIEQWLKERVRDGKTIAESQEIKSLDPKQIEPFLSLVKHFERAYLDIWVINLKGQIVSKGILPKLHLKKRNGSRGLLKRVPSSLCLRLSATVLQPAITISFAIKDTKGQPIGVLKELIALTYISELISESKLGKTGKFFIVDPQGKFVLHSRLTELLKEGTSRVSYFEKIQPN